MSETEGFLIPEYVQKRLDRYGQLFPDMQVFRGETKARVVFDRHSEGVHAYLRFGPRGQEVPTRRLVAPTQEAAVNAVITIIFNGQQKASEGGNIRFQKYGGK